MSKKSKQQQGQFFTKNSKYIIGDLIEELNLPPDAKIIDPFAGDGDLLSLFPNYTQRALDVDPKNENTEKNDSLLTPVDCTDYWVITNPPWLAKNKNKEPRNAKAFEKYNTNDLYKCAMISILACKGGIVIVPLNFWCEEQKSIREIFLSNFRVSKVKVFEEQVFADTTYTACAFSFVKEPGIKAQRITFEFWKGASFDKVGRFTEGKKYLEKTWGLEVGTDFSIGQDYIEFIRAQDDSDIKVSRFTRKDKKGSNTLVLHAQDTGTDAGKIKLVREEKTYFDETPDCTDRVFAGIKITKDGQLCHLTNKEQDTICELFNSKLNEFREQYNSMCLTNYRNSTSTLARKRLSFDSAYCLIKWAYREMTKQLL